LPTPRTLGFKNGWFSVLCFRLALKQTRSVCLRASPQYAHRFSQRVIFAG